jgi:uncharacterized membrane protein
VIADRPIPIWVDAVDRPRPGRHPQSRAPLFVAGAMSALFAVTYSWLSVARHRAYQSHAFDLGNMDQAVWNLLHGNALRFTDMNTGHAVLTSRLAIHVEPILAPLSLFYVLHSGPETLLVMQAVVVASGAIPAYLLARDVLGHAWMSLVFPLAYMAHPSLQNAVLDDFHAVVLSASFLMWALYFAYRQNTVWLCITSVLATLTKEDIGLLVAMMGLGMILMRREWRVGLAAIVGGIGWFLFCVVVVIPHFNPAGQSPYLNRYSYLGHGLGGVVAGMIRHPGVVLGTLTDHDRLAFWFALLGPLGFVSLLGAPILVLALPSVLIDLLSNDPRMYSGQYQYTAEIVPFVIASAICGTWVVQRAAASRPSGWRHSAPWIAGAVVLIASIVSTRWYGFSPLASGYVVPQHGTHQVVEDSMLRLIPHSVSVAAADEIEPHLSDRYWIYLLPLVRAGNGPAAQYIVLDASVASYPNTPKRLHAAAAWALRHAYGVLAARDGVLILRLHSGRRTIPPAFFSFMRPKAKPGQALHVRWGTLRLTGITLHPDQGDLTPSRPDLGVSMYWKRIGPIPSSARISVWLSPTYQGSHPAFSPRWKHQTDSAAWDWLPVSDWPRGQIIEAKSVPLNAQTSIVGHVDLAIQVRGLGPLRGASKASRVPRAPDLMRVATVATGL